ncbi:MAG TPA: YbaB/EbfC family nucleoid-associated protein [Chlamydiales bacterium]|nr:YbaB/EbfC family nucleoid-associated protein [Chlamydiales bacterium]
MGSGFAKMKKQALQMQKQMQQMQDELKTQEIHAEAGNGLVKVTMNGEKKLQKISIAKDCVDPSDVEGLEDLILSAMQNAYEKADQNSKTPSMPFPF